MSYGKWLDERYRQGLGLRHGMFIINIKGIELKSKQRRSSCSVDRRSRTMNLLKVIIIILVKVFIYENE